MGSLHHFTRVVVWLCMLALTVAAQQSPSMPPAQTAEVFGQKIRYYECGKGPVLILLHGTGGSGEGWARNIGPLSTAFHVYALDQIGFGHSDKPPMDYKVATYVDFLHEFMRVLGVPRATIVGQSTGGWIGASFAIEHPEMVEKLVLADSTDLPPAGGASANAPKPVDFSYASLAATRSALERFFYNQQLVTDELVRRTFQNHIQIGDGYTIQRLLANRQAEYLGDSLRSIHAPTLIIWGKEDSILPVSHAERFHAAIPSSQVMIIDDAGHVVQIEKPSEFNKAVLEFLAKNP
jgi:pimeloyl-ACP methyl ester carboxylesterase